MVHLNYAILLYNTGEKGQAAKQFDQFESKFRKFKHPNPDPEVPTMRYSLSTVAPYPGLASFPGLSFLQFLRLGELSYSYLFISTLLLLQATIERT